MKNIRIIPRLDIKGPNLVKGVNLEGLRVLGSPDYYAHHYYEMGADELIYQDTVASLYGRNSLTEIISKTTKNIFIPLTVGGGIRSTEDIKNVLRAGADKISINTAAINNPKLINEASKMFGSSTIVVAIESIKNKNGDFLAFTDNGREYTGINVLDWAIEVQDRGAGEIFITSIEREGTGLGFDEELFSLLSKKIEIPIIAHGGAGNLSDILSVIKNTNIDGVCCASMLHYSLAKNIDISSLDKTEGNIEFLNNIKNLNDNKDFTLREIKSYLKKNGINIRIDS
jgi:cyclase